MSFIVELKKKRKDEISILINDEFFGLVNQKTIKQLKIKNNIELKKEQLNILQKTLENEYCKPKALQILSLRDHSRQELSQKLKRIANANTVKKVIEKLQELKLIDDVKFAKNLAKKLILKKCYGKKRTLLELKLKGINSEIATKTVEDLKFNPTEPIIKLIKKKYFNKLNNFQSKQKVIKAILRKGHSYESILTAIKIINNQQD